MTRTFRLVVDGRGVTMLVTPGTTLDQVRQSAERRFGPARVSAVEAVEPSGVNSLNRRSKAAR